MKKTLLILSFFLVISTIQSQEGVSKPLTDQQEDQLIPTDSKVKIGTLSNGLKYYIKRNEKPENKVELRLVVNAGSLMENEDQLGLAHFVEHMNFNGLKHFKKNELVDYLQSIGVKFGAHLNAYTSFDETVYMLSLPSDDSEKLKNGFQILEDWAHNALLTGEEIDKERGVVLEEYRLRLGANKRMMDEYLPKVLYNSHYANRLPIGKKEILENFTYDKVRDFYKDWYRPDLMAVVVVGDISVNDIENKIKTHFSHIKNPESSKERKIYDVPNHEETLIAIESDKEAMSTRIQLMYKDKSLPKVDKHVMDYRAMLVKSLFTTMINNRLNELRNSQDPPFVYGFTFHGNTWARTKEAFQSIVGSGEADVIKAFTAVVQENERVKRFGFQDGEFKRAKSSMLANIEKVYNDRDKMESRRLISEYVRNFLEKESIPGIEWEFNAYKKFLPTITLAELNKLIQNFIHDDNRVVVVTGPKKEGLKQVTESEILAVLDEVKEAEIKPYEDEVIAQDLMSDLPEAGAIVKEETDDLVGKVTLTLSNGSKVIYKKTDFKNDEILFSAYRHGGTSTYTDEEYLKTGLANNGLAEAGINGFTKIELGKLLTGKVVRANTYIGNDKEGIGGSSTVKDFETLFQLIHLYFTSLNKDENAYNAFVGKQKSQLKNFASNPNVFYNIEMAKFKANGDPRFIGLPADEDWDRMNYNLAFQKYNQRFGNARGFNFYFVGNIDEEKIREFASTYVASLPSKDGNETFKDLGRRPLYGVHEKIVHKGTDPKSMVNISYNGEAEFNGHESYYLSCVAQILNIKLIEQLREEKSGVYGARASGRLSKLPYGNYSFNISFPCGPENAIKLKDATLAEVQKIIDHGPTEKDLNKIKEAQLLEYKESLKKNRWWLRRIEYADYADLDRHEFTKTEELINSLTIRNVQDVAKKYLVKNRIIGMMFPEEE